jgi:hypothetical protein
MRNLLTLAFASLLCSYSVAQNVGIGTAAPVAKLDINGDAAIREGIALPLGNGLNNNIPVTLFSFYRITGPTAAFSLTGFAAGQDGKILIVYNTTAFPMTISNENISSTANNRIRTLTGADVVTPATNGATVSLIYNSTTQRWLILTATQPPAGASSDWTTSGNAGTSAALNFIGTTDAVDWVMKANNIERGRITSPGFIQFRPSSLPTWATPPYLTVKTDAANGYALQLLLDDPNTANSRISFGTGAGTGTIETLGNIALNTDVRGNSLTTGYQLRTVDAASVLTNRFTVQSGVATANIAMINSNVGVGTTTPSTRFHVAGSSRFQDGTEGVDKIMRSDALGNASWTYPAIAIRSTWMAGGIPNADPILTSNWCNIYDTGVNGEIRIENPAASGNTIKYVVKVDALPVMSNNLAPGASFVATNLHCANEIMFRVARYSTTLDQYVVTYIGMGMCNGHLRGHLIYDK